MKVSSGARVRVLLAGWGLAVLGGCVSDGDLAPPDSIPIGLLLSYTGISAASSINSERAALLAVERINQGGGVAGRPVRLEVRNIQSDGPRAIRMFNELDAQKVPAVIGPDSPNAINYFILAHREHTLFLPSVALSARDFIFGARNWFTFAPNTWTLGCAFKRRLAQEGLSRPAIVYAPDSFHTELAVALKMLLSAPNRGIAVPSSSNLTAAQVDEIVDLDKDSLLLITFPEAAVAVVNELSFRTRLSALAWFLSPTLHSNRFFDNVPAGALQRVLGPRPARVATEGFEQAFARRWNDKPLDEAYAFYDAAALAALALQAAITATGALPDAKGLGAYVRPVATQPGAAVRWDQLAEGIQLVAQGMDVDYQGVSGDLEFNEAGDPARTLVQWWRLAERGPELDGEPVATMEMGRQCND